MKSNKSLLVKVGLGIVAIFALWLVSDTYLKTTSSSREADQAIEEIDEDLRKLREATQRRKERERLENP